MMRLGGLWILLVIVSVAPSYATTMPPPNSFAEPLRTVSWDRGKSAGRIFFGGEVLPAKPPRTATLRIRNQTSQTRVYRLARFETPPVKKEDWVIIARARCQGRRNGCVLRATSRMHGVTLRKQADVVTFSESTLLPDSWGKLGLSFHSVNDRPTRIEVTVSIPAHSSLEIGPIRLFEGAHAASYPESAVD